MKVADRHMEDWGKLVHSYLNFAVLEHGQNESDAINARDEDGNTPLHVFAMRQRRNLRAGGLGEFSLNPVSLRVLRSILRRGAELTTKINTVKQ